MEEHTSSNPAVVHTVPGPPELTEQISQSLDRQNSRLVSKHVADEVERNNKKYWDLFYKRNETRFFKDRNWTVNEFDEFMNEDVGTGVLLEVGCGVGNFIFPLLSWSNIRYIHACDISPRAIEFVKQNPLYNADKMNAFPCDVTEDSILTEISHGSVDIATLIFVLSAIHPDKFALAVANLFTLLRPGGIVLFRDYGLYDMAQLRFKPGHKISDKLYMRQDKTRSYFFSTKEVLEMFTRAGFDIISCNYLTRKTINVKENIDVDRTFVQAKVRKPVS
uniref:tRNA N(3)-methylcytidine methyltransferase n=1 Tax=Cacopsylla melanoneura TaxID=428564 RepID=A0A8D8Q3J3_9HEMI